MRRVFVLFMLVLASLSHASYTKLFDISIGQGDLERSKMVVKGDRIFFAHQYEYPDANGGDYIIVRCYDLAGNTKWSRVINDSAGNVLKDIDVDFYGSVLVMESPQGLLPSTRIHRINQTGTVLWTKSYSEIARNLDTNVQDLFVATHKTLRKLDINTGSTLWSRDFSSTFDSVFGCQLSWDKATILIGGIKPFAGYKVFESYEYNLSGTFVLKSTYTAITYDTLSNVVDPIFDDRVDEHNYYFKFTGNGSERYQDSNGATILRTIYSKSDSFVDTFKESDTFGGTWRRTYNNGTSHYLSDINLNYYRMAMTTDPKDLMYIVGKYDTTNRLTLEAFNEYDSEGGTFSSDTSLDYGRLIASDRLSNLYVLGKKGVTIRMLKFRHRPVVRNDNFDVPKNGQFQSSYSVARNDFGVYSGTSLGVVTMMTQPQHGVANLSSTGHVQYVPDSNYFGSDHFDYRITANGYSDTGRIYLHVTPKLASISVAETVTGGNFAPVTVTFEGEVSSNQVVVLRDTVRNQDTSFNFQAGQTQSAFSYYVPPVASARSATITATTGGVSKSDTTTIVPLKLDRVTLTSNTIIGGYARSGNVFLNGVAPLGGIVVQLTSNYAGMTLNPTSVTIPEGSTSASFTVSTSVVSANLTRRITAAALGNSVYTDLTMTPGGLRYFTVSPLSVKGGSSMVGTLTLSGIIGGNTSITMYPTQTLNFPTTVNVPAGSLSNNFMITSTSVSSTVQRSITANLGSVSKTVTVTLTP